MTSKRIWMLLGAVAAAAAVALFWRDKQRPAPEVKSVETGPRPIGCLGRIEPADGITKVASPSSFGRAVVAQLRVKEGDSVRKNDILAVLDNHSDLLAAVKQARLQEDVARLRVAQTSAGPKPADVASQQAEIARIEGQLTNAQQEHRRYAELLQTGDVSALEVDQKALQVRSLEESLAQAKQQLNALSQVRQADLDVAEAQVSVAEAERSRALLNSSLAYIRAPFSGRILAIHARVGEEISPDGLLEIASLEEMYVVAEVDEEDLPRLRAGQTATISSTVLPHELRGTVEEIGTEISRSQILPLDPVADTDRRIAKTRIRLEPNDIAQKLIYAQVNVLIQP